jgi:2,3,4,5-tetrahydropyridine-2-carboxylate N-succinyltransferase/tetrahydrodipicolinate N-acetyltransferase
MSDKLDFITIADLIANSRKTTPSRVFLTGSFSKGDFKYCEFKVFGEGKFFVLVGDFPLIKKWMKTHKKKIEEQHIEISGRYSALPMIDLDKVEARIEPGAVIREGARIGKDCIVMMGAVINIGAEIGTRTMIDMNAVIGARAMIGRDCHIGAGAVIAGVLEPPSRKPVVIQDGVLVGANAVVLVVDDIPPRVIAVGMPAKVVRKIEEVKDQEKISLVKILRNRK